MLAISRCPDASEYVNDVAEHNLQIQQNRKQPDSLYFYDPKLTNSPSRNIHFYDSIDRQKINKSPHQQSLNSTDEPLCVSALINLF